MANKINSRSKGNTNERRLAALFATWTKRTFARVPSSGGLSWKTANAKGDIICTKEGHYFPFCIEAKNYKEINFQHLLYLDNAKILEFWAQCTRDAKIANKIPILTMRYNGMPKDLHFVVIPNDFALKLINGELIDPKNYMRFISKNHKLMIYTSTDFFQTDYSKVKTLAKQYLGYGKK